jgi:small subunit ribosomal protein S3
MGQKIHPKAFRLGYVQDWQSRWFSPKNMPALIREDYDIRSLISEKFRFAAVSWVGIERAGSFLRVNIHTARPGVIIGKKGVDIENLRAEIEKLTGSKTFVNVVEVKTPELEAKLVADAIAMQLEKRAHYASAMKRAIDKAMSAKALGIKIMVAGRLGGSEIARTEWKREGRVPLHTLCADIDYGFSEANTMMGKIGVKVWIFKKLHFAKSPREVLSELRKANEMNEDGSFVGEKTSPVSEENREAKPTRAKTAPKKTVSKKVKAVKEEETKKESDSNVDAKES